MRDLQDRAQPGTALRLEEAHAGIEVCLVLEPKWGSLMEQLNLRAQVGDAVAGPQDLLERETGTGLLANTGVHNSLPADSPRNTRAAAYGVHAAALPKFAAALQASQTGEAPVLIRVETSAGHGAGKPTSKLIAERTDFLTFLEHALRRVSATTRPG